MKPCTSLILCAAILLSGCGTMAPLFSDQSQPAKMIKMTAVGYGTGSSFERYPEGQKKLMAMRASKLDAYRAMAEQIYGVRIMGNSTVSAMMAQSDSFRVYIDAYVRGARILTVTAMPDGNYETTIEMDFDDQLVRNAAARAYSPSSSTKGGVGAGGTYGSSFYYAE